MRLVVSVSKDVRTRAYHRDTETQRNTEVVFQKDSSVPLCDSVSLW